ncbi:hypothetical protein Tco_0664399 [Tanacetum coccineum]
MTPRSYLRWKPTGKIFKTVGLRCVPTGKIFTSSTTKVDSDATNDSNEDITNQYDCEQTLDVSAGTMFLNLDQLEKKLDNEEFQEIGSMASFKVLETQFQMFIKSRIYLDDEYTIEEKVDTSKALDASLVDTESSRIESKEWDTSSRSVNDTHADDANIRPIYDEETMAEVQLIADHNVFAT